MKDAVICSSVSEILYMRYMRASFFYLSLVFGVIAENQDSSPRP